MKKLNLWYRAYRFNDSFSNEEHFGYISFNLHFSKEKPFVWFNLKTN